MYAIRSYYAHVFNYDLPDTAENYTHRIGRTGRAERTGEAISLATFEDAQTVRMIERAIGKSIERVSLEGFVAPAVDTDAPQERRAQPRGRQDGGRGGRGGRGGDRRGDRGGDRGDGRRDAAGQGRAAKPAAKPAPKAAAKPQSGNEGRKAANGDERDPRSSAPAKAGLPSFLQPDGRRGGKVV